MAAREATADTPNFLHYYQEGMSFGRWLEILDEQERGIDLPSPQHAPSTFLFGFVGEELVGRTSIRHRLTPRLERVGGHIGYAVVPRFRGRGYATEILRQSLDLAREEFGIQMALVTCDEDNAASRRVIEKCGGVLQDIIDGPDLRAPKRRYWIET